MEIPSEGELPLLFVGQVESMYNDDDEPDARYNSLGFRLAQD